jgi:hypothetical protein
MKEESEGAKDVRFILHPSSFILHPSLSSPRGKEWKPVQSPHFTFRAVAALFIASAVAYPGRAIEPEKYLPANTQGTLVINVQQIAESPAMQAYGVEAFKKYVSSNGEVSRYCNSTGLDLVRDIQKVVIGATVSGNGESKYAIVIRGRHDLDNVRDALVREGAAKIGDLHGANGSEVRLYEIRPQGSKEKPVYAAFVDKNTLIISQTSEQTMAAAKGEGQSNAALTAALRGFDGAESMYGAFVMSNEMKKALAGNQVVHELVTPIQHITVSFNLTSDLKIQFAVQTPDAKSADMMKTFVTRTKPFLDELASSKADTLGTGINELMRGVQIQTDEKNAVNIKLTVTEAMLKQMSENVKSQAAIEKRGP